MKVRKKPKNVIFKWSLPVRTSEGERGVITKLFDLMPFSAFWHQATASLGPDLFELYFIPADANVPRRKLDATNFDETFKLITSWASGQLQEPVGILYAFFAKHKGDFPPLTIKNLQLHNKYNNNLASFVVQ